MPDEDKDARTIERYRAKFADEVEPQLAERLERASIIRGEDFTAANCVVGHGVYWARSYRMCRSDVFKRYLDRLSERPALRKAFADAGQFQAAPPAGREGPSPFTG